MNEEELIEISEAFEEAWDEFFAQEMFLIPLSPTTEIHPLYGETYDKRYDYTKRVPFLGTYKEEMYKERGEINGRDNYEKGEITLVTHQLSKQGIPTIDQSSIIEINHRNGLRKVYNIIGNYGKVQLGNAKIFTKIEVVEITNFQWGTLIHESNE